MKNTLMLAVILSLFVGAVAAQETDRMQERCGDSVCEVAGAQGLYTDLDEISSSIDEVSSTLERCETDHCRSVRESAELRQSLISRAEESGRAGEIEQMTESLETVKTYTQDDIRDGARELEEGDTDRETVERVIGLEEDIMSQIDSALKKADITSKVASAIECPEDKCGAGEEASVVCGDGVCRAEVCSDGVCETRAEFCPDGSCGVEVCSDGKCGEEVCRGDDCPVDSTETPETSRPDPVDADSDGDGISDLVEGRVEDDGTIYCWGRSCEVPAKADLSDEGSVYCWGNRCELPSEAMQSDYDGEVYCWGNRCEPPTEKSNGGPVYCWGDGCPTREPTTSEPDVSEPVNPEEEQEPSSDESARPETGEDRPDGDEENEQDSGAEESSDGVNPVNDPPQTRMDRFRSSIGGLVGNIFGR
jgi:hypothetical protein